MHRLESNPAPERDSTGKETFMIILVENKPYITDFNSNIPLADFRINEQHYTRTTKIWYHASKSKIDAFSQNIPKRDPLTHFSTKKEFSIDFYRYYRGRKDRFGYLHFCRLKESVNLVNFQSKQDYDNFIVAVPGLKGFIDKNLIQNNSSPRYFMHMEDSRILEIAKLLSYDGVATFGDNPHKIKGFHEAENIGLFDATLMRVTDIRIIDLITNKISKNTYLFAPEDQEPVF
jgi:hypothetical protein